MGTYAGYGGVPKNSKEEAYISKFIGGKSDGLQHDEYGDYNSLEEQARASWLRDLASGKETPY